MKTWMKMFIGLFTVCVLFYSMLVNIFYEEGEEEKRLCVATGGMYDDHNIKPWRLVEGECKK